MAQKRDRFGRFTRGQQRIDTPPPKRDSKGRFLPSGRKKQGVRVDGVSFGGYKRLKNGRYVDRKTGRFLKQSTIKKLTAIGQANAIRTNVKRGRGKHAKAAFTIAQRHGLTQQQAQERIVEWADAYAEALINGTQLPDFPSP